MGILDRNAPPLTKPVNKRETFTFEEGSRLISMGATDFYFRNNSNFVFYVYRPFKFLPARILFCSQEPETGEE